MAIFQSAPIDEVQSRDACSETKCSPQNIGCLPAPHSLVALAKLCLICPFSQPSTPSSSSTKLLTAQRSSFKLNKAPHSSTPLLQVQQSSAQLDTLSSSSTGLCIAQHTLSKLNKAPQSSTPLLKLNKALRSALPLQAHSTNDPRSITTLAEFQRYRIATTKPLTIKVECNTMYIHFAIAFSGRFEYFCSASKTCFSCHFSDSPHPPVKIHPANCIDDKSNGNQHPQN